LTIADHEGTPPGVQAGQRANEVDVGNAVAKALSISFFITAAILGLFGAATMGSNQGSAFAQLGLGVVMLGAGLFLRQGTAEARIAGLAAAALTSAFGAFELLTSHGYVPGTIVAIFAFARLAGASGAFGEQPSSSQHPASGYAHQAHPAQQTYPSQPAYPANPAPMGYFQTPAPATADPVMPTPSAPPPDSRFGS
jgi:hypothetical protein